MEKTLFIIKPDALSKGFAGKILDEIQKKGFKIAAMKMVKLSKKQAQNFYMEHKGKRFYKPLVEFMASNPCVVCVLERKSAIKFLRKITGTTDPKNAKKGTLRKKYAQDGRHNAVHASDSLKSAKREISFFFNKNEIFSWKKKKYPVLKATNAKKV